MIIKKFVGKTEEEATQQAKDELGESIVIMNVKLIRKGGFFSFLSKPKTEVTVAKEEEDVMKSITNKKNSHPEEKIIEKEDFSSVKVSGPHISSIDIKVGEDETQHRAQYFARALEHQEYLILVTYVLIVIGRLVLRPESVRDEEHYEPYDAYI